MVETARFRSLSVRCFAARGSAAYKAAPKQVRILSALLCEGSSTVMLRWPCGLVHRRLGHGSATHSRARGI